MGQNSGSYSNVKVRFHIYLRRCSTSLLSLSEDFLKTLFIVSDAFIIDEGSLGTTSPEWLYTDSLSIPGKCSIHAYHTLSDVLPSGCESDLGIRVRPAVLGKCPRCWTFTRAEDVLCGRCSEVVSSH